MNFYKDLKQEGKLDWLFLEDIIEMESLTPHTTLKIPGHSDPNLLWRIIFLQKELQPQLLAGISIITSESFFHAF